jgi:hypothetical protein
MQLFQCLGHTWKYYWIQFPECPTVNVAIFLCMCSIHKVQDALEVNLRFRIQVRQTLNTDVCFRPQNTALKVLCER